MCTWRVFALTGASAISLVPRPKDRTRLLSSAHLYVAFLYRHAGRELGILVSRGYLSSFSSSTPCFLLCSGLTQPVLFLVCCCNSAERCHVPDSTFLFEAPPLFAWVTLRTRLCHIDDPLSFTSRTSMSTTP